MGRSALENGYDFTNLDRCRDRVEVPAVRGAGGGVASAPGTAGAAGGKGVGADAPRFGGRRGSQTAPAVAAARQGHDIRIHSRLAGATRTVLPGDGARGRRMKSCGRGRRGCGEGGARTRGAGATSGRGARGRRGSGWLTGGSGTMRFDRATGRLTRWERGGVTLPVSERAETGRVPARRFGRTWTCAGRRAVRIHGGARTGRVGGSVQAGRFAARRGASRAGDDGVRFEYEYGHEGPVDVLGVGVRRGRGLR